MKTKRWLLPALVFALSGAAFAQTDSARFYKLDYVVKEVEGGKAVNSRAFSAMLAVQSPGRDVSAASIRSSGRVPVTSGANTQYFDLGVNIDTKDLRETQGDLSLYVSADISTIGQDTSSSIPVVRQNRWSGTVMVTPKKPTVIFASDDITSKRQLQLELTVTPIK